jgi:uncharacterized protein YdeI (BOF family)
MLAHKKLLTLACVPVLALAVASAAFAAPTAADTSSTTRVVPIGAARDLPAGTTVTVEGSATVPSGLFASSFGDEGFAIQDASGGIYVSIADNLGIKLQQRVRVTGQVQDSSGLIVLVPAADADVTVLGHGFKVRQQWERTGNVGPANQGRLIFVVGFVTQPVEPDPPFGQKIFLNDGSGELRVFINTSTGIDVSSVTQGQFLSISGFSSAFDTPELDPRFQIDVRAPAH